jgi:hypothetical protein
MEARLRAVGRRESIAKLVISGGDPAELLELVEEAFDKVALAVEGLSPAKALLAPDHVGDVGDGAAGLDVSSEPVGVISLVVR